MYTSFTLLDPRPVMMERYECSHSWCFAAGPNLALRIHPMAPPWSLALEDLHRASPGRHPLGAATKAIGACGRAQLWQWALEVSDLVKVQGGTVGLQGNVGKGLMGRPGEFRTFWK